MDLHGSIIDITSQRFGFGTCHCPSPQGLGSLTAEISHERLIFAEALQHL
jgi:hypothetical protein